MRAAVQIPTDAVDPGDSYELYAEVLLWNSVDRSRAFELAIRWKRLVCKNGLTISNEDRMRKIHNVDWMAGESPIDFLTDRLPASRNRMVEIGQWLNVHLEENRLIEWANHDVTKQWGIIRAARLVHVLRTGRDCAVGKPREGKRASQVEVVPGNTVPGARAPVGNAYHAYQALLWITNAEHSIDMQEASRRCYRAHATTLAVQCLLTLFVDCHVWMAMAIRRSGAASSPATPTASRPGLAAAPN